MKLCADALGETRVRHGAENRRTRITSREGGTAHAGRLGYCARCAVLLCAVTLCALDVLTPGAAARIRGMQLQSTRTAP